MLDAVVAPRNVALVLDVAVTDLSPGLVTFVACLVSLSLPTFISGH